MTNTQLVLWVGAASTFLAVLVALFRDELRALWQKPKLIASIKLEAPDCHLTEMKVVNRQTGQVIGAAACYYLRIWVENTGSERAEQVQVFASRLFRRQADGSYKQQTQFLPMNLRWAHSQQGPFGPEIFAEGISPGMGKHCDLGHIVDPASNLAPSVPGASSGQFILELDLEIAPNTMSHLILPGTYRLELKLAAANSKPVVKTVEITLTGAWYSDESKMFSDGLGLREV